MGTPLPPPPSAPQALSSSPAHAGVRAAAGHDDEWAVVAAVLAAWLVRTRRSQLAHYAASRLFRTLGTVVGVPAVVLTTAVGAVALGALGEEVGERTKVGLAAASITAAVLTAVQTHFRLGQRAERHTGIGARYGAVRRRLEELLALPASARPSPAEALAEVRRLLDAVAADADTVPGVVWRRAVRHLAGREPPPAAR